MCVRIVVAACALPDPEQVSYDQLLAYVVLFDATHTFIFFAVVAEIFWPILICMVCHVPLNKG